MVKSKTEPTARTIEILSVRLKRNKIALSWMEGKDKHSVEFHEAALPAFLRSVEALRPHALSLCELPAKDLEKIVTTGITCREKGDNVLALITVKKKVRKGARAYPFSTPLLPMLEDPEKPTADHMAEEECKAIQKVISEAKKYILGDRAQGEFKFEDGEEEEEENKEDEKKGEQTATLPFPPTGSA